MSEFRENIDQLLAAEKMRVERYTANEAEIARATSAIDVVKKVEAAGAIAVLAGGYGLDALYGKITRDHGDADLLCLSSDKGIIQGTLEMNGFQRVQASNVKDVYVHPANPSFKIEIGFDQALRLFGENDTAAFMPDEPNAHLLDSEMRAVPVEGQMRINQIQTQRAKEGSWGTYSAEKAINREFLIKELVKRSHQST